MHLDDSMSHLTGQVGLDADLASIYMYPDDWMSHLIGQVGLDADLTSIQTTNVKELI